MLAGWIPNVIDLSRECEESWSSIIALVPPTHAVCGRSHVLEDGRDVLALFDLELYPETAIQKSHGMLWNSRPERLL